MLGRSLLAPKPNPRILEGANRESRPTRHLPKLHPVGGNYDVERRSTALSGSELYPIVLCEGGERMHRRSTP
jgi:hypothetical protein